MVRQLTFILMRLCWLDQMILDRQLAVAFIVVDHRKTSRRQLRQRRHTPAGDATQDSTRKEGARMCNGGSQTREGRGARGRAPNLQHAPPLSQVRRRRLEPMMPTIGQDNQHKVCILCLLVIHIVLCAWRDHTAFLRRSIGRELMHG